MENEFSVTIKTSNRKLENVLYYLGVHYAQCDKNEDGMTVWTYIRTEKVDQIVKWFREECKRKERNEW